MGAKMNVISGLESALSTKYLERKELVHGMLTALVSGEPLLMLGPPGTAKSMICHDICNAIGGDYFSLMLTKMTVPEELFGPLSLKGLENDKYLRLTDGYLPKAHVGFIDEIFKSSSAILNTLLTILNEKKFYNGGKFDTIPLLALFAASNEIPTAEELSALYDRFVLKFSVEYVKNEQSARALFTGLQDVKIPTITQKQIAEAREAASKVKVSNSVVDLLLEIKQAISKDGMTVSDRKYVQAVRVLKSATLVNGRDEVEADDLDILTNVLWSTPDQKTKVRRIVSRLSNPVGDKILQIMDGVNDMVRELNNGKGDAIEVFKKLKIGLKEIEKLGDPKRNAKIEASMTAIKGYQKDLAQKHLGMEG